MLFNSLDFAVFLPIIFILYWFIFNKSLKIQNTLVLVASYVFYGWWDWRFLLLIIFSSIVDFLCGIYIQNATTNFRRKFFLSISILSNLGLLGFFKYYNFFISSFEDAFSIFGYNFQGHSLNIILPVGISFYTFQTLSYTIDIYNKKLVPTRDIIGFFAFVSFFPQLVAGPIERASNLLPQFHYNRTFNNEKAKDGMRFILWGLFKKVVIADNCALFVNEIFADYDSMSSGNLVLGSIFFAFQIYGDFSGYSDIAIGTAKLLGFDLMRNFAYPYFSRDIAEFWRRWHISLSTWFKDYLYIPIGGSKGSNFMKARNIMIIFIVSGFWHGANWTFVFWGLLNGLYFLPLILRGKNRRYTESISKDKRLPSFREFRGILVTFSLTCLAWIFFRAESLPQAFDYISQIFTSSILTFNISYFSIIPFIVFMLSLEWIQREKQCPLNFNNLNTISRNFVYYFLIGCILYLKPNQEISFIYFQF